MRREIPQSKHHCFTMYGSALAVCLCHHRLTGGSSMTERARQWTISGSQRCGAAGEGRRRDRVAGGGDDVGGAGGLGAELPRRQQRDQVRHVRRAGLLQRALCERLHQPRVLAAGSRVLGSGSVIQQFYTADQDILQAIPLSSPCKCILYRRHTLHARP